MSSFAYSVLGFIIALGILVTIHEFGHFWVARRLGVKVLRFSVGFGRPLWLRRAGADRTEYAIGMIPLGGYVKMLDENEGKVAPEERHRAFNRQPLLTRSAVVLAGPFANFLFAVVAYTLVFLLGITGLKPVVGKVAENSPAAAAGFQLGDEVIAIDGRPTRIWDEHRMYLFNKALAGERVVFQVRDAEGRLRERTLDLSRIPAGALDAGFLERVVGLYGYIPEVPPVIGRVIRDSPAARAGLRPGDRITALDGTPVTDWERVVTFVQRRPGKRLELEIERHGQRLAVALVTETVETEDGPVGRIGVTVQPVPIPEAMRARARYGPFAALTRGVESTWLMGALTVEMLIKMIKLEVSAKNISGPLTIAQYAGHSVRVGLDRFLVFLAVVSVSLGVLNLLPIPVLDGGHLLFHVLEAIKGGPLSKQAMLRGQQVGILLLAGLMGLAFYNDLVRILQ